MMTLYLGLGECCKPSRQGSRCDAPPVHTVTAQSWTDQLQRNCVQPASHTVIRCIRGVLAAGSTARAVTGS